MELLSEIALLFADVPEEEGALCFIVKDEEDDDEEEGGGSIFRGAQAFLWSLQCSRWHVDEQ